MKGNCGSEFQPYTSCCECCNSYGYCMKKYQEYNPNENEKNPGDNYPLRPFEQEINNNKEKFKRYRPITEAEVLAFSYALEHEYTAIDNFIKALELYKEEK